MGKYFFLETLELFLIKCFTIENYPFFLQTFLCVYENLWHQFLFTRI